MNPIVIKAIELLLSLLAPFLKSLVDLAYKKIEDWAKREEKATGVKPQSAVKMAMATAMVKEKRPDVSEAAIKALLELHHAQAVGKTAGAK